MFDKYLSLDIETSSDDLNGSILSIALIKYDDMNEVYREVRYPNGVFIKPEAMRVNMIDARELDNKENMTLAELDKYIVNDFIGKENYGKYTIMGAGINYFDRQFIQKDLPKLNSCIKRAMFDINSYLRGICLQKKMHYDSIKHAIYTYFESIIVKEFHEKYAKDENHPQNAKQYFSDMKFALPHNALFDARRNIFYLEECIKLL